VSIDGPKYGTIVNPRCVEPSLKRPDGAVNSSAEGDADPPTDAVLVGLGAPDGQNDPLPDGPLDGRFFVRLRAGYSFAALLQFIPVHVGSSAFQNRASAAFVSFREPVRTLLNQREAY